MDKQALLTKLELIKDKMYRDLIIPDTDDVEILQNLYDSCIRQIQEESKRHEKLMLDQIKTLMCQSHNLDPNTYDDLTQGGNLDNILALTLNGVLHPGHVNVAQEIDLDLLSCSDEDEPRDTPYD